MSPASARSASESSSFPPPAATPKQAASLRADLADSGWGVEAVAALLGEVADAALRREIRLPALRAVRAALAAGAAPSPVAVLTALFMLGDPVPVTALDAALPRTTAAGAAAVGLVGEPDGAGYVRALVDLRPHEAVDDAGEVRWWVASDLGELVTGRALAPDHVLGVGGAGLTLAGLTPRTPVRTALDLGCGCGIQTLYLLRHAEHVVATDISARALAFTAFNAALAGTGLSANIELKNSVVSYPGMEAEVVETVERLGWGGRVIYSSFNHASMRLMARMGERVGLLYDEVLRRPTRYALDLGAAALHPSGRVMAIAPHTVRKAHRKGIEVNVWTLDRPEQVRAALALDVDAIITNTPDAALGVRDAAGGSLRPDKGTRARTSDCQLSRRRA